MPPTDTLVITSAYPRFPGDFAGRFVAEQARACGVLGGVRVLAPADAAVEPGYAPFDIPILRYASLFNRWSGPFYGAGGPDNLRRRSVRLSVPYAVSALLSAARRENRTAARLVAHWLVPAGFAAAMVKRRDQRLQVIVHGGDWRWLSASAYGRALALGVLWRADDVVAVAPWLAASLSAAVPARFRAAFKRKLRVLPMGLDTQAYVAAAPDPEVSGALPRPPLILGVGRLVPIKGFDRLIEALAGLVADGREARLRLIGDGPERGRLAALAARSGVALDLPGALDGDALAAEYAAATVVALPSRGGCGGGEGLPRVLLEAMAAGCAVAASDSGGVASVVRHDENGLLDEGKNATLRSNLARLLTDSALRRRLGERAQADARDYDWRVLGPKFVEPFTRRLPCSR